MTITSLGRVRQFMTIATTCVVMCASATAANLWCVGPVANLWIDQSGNAFLHPSWHQSYVLLCNVNQNSTTGVTPTTCMSWVSLARAAMQRAVPMTIYYEGIAATSCNAIPEYSAATPPYYVMLNQ